MKVSQYMSLSVVTVTPQTEFHRAFDLMRSRNIHHLPVVDDGQVVGIVAERDLLLAAANFGRSEVPVGEIMHSPAVCIAESALLKEAARLLVVQHIGSLPVLDSKKALVGIITETDVFKIAAGMLRARPAVRKTAARTTRRAPKKAARRAPKKTVKGGKPAARKTTRPRS
jgi:acetoin utilization protein AcuB